MEKKKGVESTVEQIQKREKRVTSLIIVIAVFIGILIAFLFTGILELFYK